LPPASNFKEPIISHSADAACHPWQPLHDATIMPEHMFKVKLNRADFAIFLQKVLGGILNSFLRLALV